MRVSFRLYRMHDIDLVTLYKNPNFGFQKALKKALKAYVHKEPYFIFPPDTTDVSDKDFKYGYQIFMTLDEKKDADIIAWFKDIKPRGRGEAIKAVLRGSIIGPIAYGSMKTDNDRVEHDEFNKVFKELLIKNVPDELKGYFYNAPARREKYTKKKSQNKQNNKLQNDRKVLKLEADNNKSVSNNLKEEHKNNSNDLDNNGSNITSNNSNGNKDKDINLDIVNDNNLKVIQDQDHENENNNSNKSNDTNDANGFSFDSFDFNGFGEQSIEANTDNSDNNDSTDDDFDLFASADSLINQFK